IIICGFHHGTIFIFLIQTFHYKQLLFYYSDCSKRSTSFTSSSVISFSSFCSSCSFPFSSTGDSLSIVSCMLPICAFKSIISVESSSSFLKDNFSCLVSFSSTCFFSLFSSAILFHHLEIYLYL